MDFLLYMKIILVPTWGAWVADTPLPLSPSFLNTFLTTPALGVLRTSMASSESGISAKGNENRAFLQASVWGWERVQGSNLELAPPLDKSFPLLEGPSPVKASRSGATRGQCGAASRSVGAWPGAGSVPSVPAPDQPPPVLSNLPRPRVLRVWQNERGVAVIQRRGVRLGV